MENKKNLNLLKLENDEGLKAIRMCSFDINTLLEMDKLALEDYKNKTIKNFDSEAILIIIREFIRLKNDYDSLQDYIKKGETDTMTYFQIESHIPRID